MLAVLKLRHQLTQPVHPLYIFVFCWSNDYETAFKLALKSAYVCNSLKQDFLNKPALQSENQQISSFHFFCNEQTARRL